jgi:hypothetical protein
MKLIFTKLTDQSHRLEIVRTDGTHETRELVTRELLFHDLLHYTVETVAGLRGGFYGRLARGDSLNAVDDAAKAELQNANSEIAIVERTVGMVTGVLEAPPPDEPKLRAIDRTLEGSGMSRPAWLDAAFLERVRETMRQLQGRWKAVPFGGSMALDFAGEKRRVA